MNCLFLSKDVSHGISPSLGIIGLSTVVILGLGESVSTSLALQPASAFGGSTLDVPVSEVNELSGLGHVLLVGGILLGFIGGANLLVLFQSQTGRNVRVGSNFSLLELWNGMKE